MKQFRFFSSPSSSQGKLSSAESLPLPVLAFIFDSGVPGEGEKVLQVYSRKKKFGTTIVPPVPSQDVSSASDPDPGNSSSLPDSDLITIWKCVRSCVKHPLSNFVSYQFLSPSYRHFALALAFVSVPRNVADALSQPQWKAVMHDEIVALEKMVLGILLICLRTKSMLDASGFIPSSANLMGPLIVIRFSWSQKATPIPMGLIIRRPLPLLQK